MHACGRERGIKRGGAFFVRDGALRCSALAGRGIKRGGGGGLFRSAALRLSFPAPPGTHCRLVHGSAAALPSGRRDSGGRLRAARRHAA